MMKKFLGVVLTIILVAISGRAIADGAQTSALEPVIDATFAAVKKFTITATAGSGGTISPKGKVKVPAGSSRTFTISAKKGYVLKNVSVDGKKVGAVKKYTFKNVTANHTIKATFAAAKKFTITATAGSGGTISPKGKVKVPVGGSRTFTISVEQGYVLKDVSVDGETVGAVTTYTFENVTANHTIQATFVEVTLSIAIIGLGDTIKVVNTPDVTIAGVAESDIGISRVEFCNATTNVKGIANGTTEWSAAIKLVQGDNNLNFTAVASDDSRIQISTVLTYSPAIDFTTPLVPSHSVLYTGETQNVTFTIGLANQDNPLVDLYNTDQNGNVQSEAGQMLDNGVLPDEIQGDGLFTIRLQLTPAETGYACYRTEVARGGVTYYSENTCLWVTSHFTEAAVQNAVDTADSAKEKYDDAVNSGASLQEAAQTVATQLKSDSQIGAAGATDDGGLWWMSSDGILGLYHYAMEGQKAGGGKQAGPRGPANAGKPLPSPGKAVAQVRYYPPQYLADQSHYVPFGTSKTLAPSGALAAEKNAIKSKKALIISPYINNPNDGPNFGTSDDYYGPWKVIQDTKSCTLYAAKEALNNGSVNVTVDTFKELSDFGYIHISSHADNLYKGLLSLWKPEWGTNDWLKGALSQVVIYTGVKLPQNPDGTINMSGYEDDVKAKRMAVAADGAIALLPGFFTYYTGKLPNSLVVLSACRSKYNNSMANAFLTVGAGAVVGFTDYVKSSYAQNTTTKIIESLLAGETLDESIDDAIAAYGSNDADKSPAYLQYAGAGDLVLSSELFVNGGFEDGVLTPWTPSGDGRILTQLGSTSPTEGSFMGIISTGLGYTTSNGTLEQDFCALDKVGTLSFDWNFFSEEFVEYCGSIYQDAFHVSMCVIDDATGAETCDLLFSRAVDDLCGGVSKSDIGFDRGDVYNTGWNHASIDISAYAGKHLRLKFFTTDVGDSIYDTAVLIDAVTIANKP